MIVSNEPGVYFDNQYGIRIENLCMVREVYSQAQSATGHGPFYGFEDLTLVPYCRKLINKRDLSPEEIDAVNEYHRLVYTTLKDYFAENKPILKWLKRETKPL
jgi:Xaa-Pro aminopeptidase